VSPVKLTTGRGGEGVEENQTIRRQKTWPSITIQYSLVSSDRREEEKDSFSNISRKRKIILFFFQNKNRG
jgi:hypothetical protein